MSLVIEHILEQKHTAREARPPRYMPLRTASDALSRRNIAKAHCEVLNEALHALTALCYETEKHIWLNIDHATGRILIPMPCGSRGRFQWGLRRTEADALRLILFAYMDNKKIAPLFVYDAITRSWYVNLFDYPTREWAHYWLRRCPVTIDSWFIAVSRLRGDG